MGATSRMAIGHPREIELADRRIMVTGAGGFVGRRLCDALRSQKAFVIGAGRRGDAVGQDGVDFDLLDASAVDAAISRARPDVIVHLAAQSSVGQGAGRTADTWATNLGGSLNLARALAHSAPHACLLFASSSEVYGRAFLTGKADENTMPQPQSAYARSKRAAEDMLADVLAVSNQLIVARPGNHTGGGQDNRFVAPSFATQIVKGGDVLVGNLQARRDFLHVDDVVDAYVALIKNRPALPSRSIFNVASGVPVKIGSLLERLIQLSQSAPNVVIDPDMFRPVDIEVAELDASKIRDIIGWAPRRSLDDALLDVLGAVSKA
jgi:GDP-4-dehydro-6-deoxy-D-mannose reductase